MTGVRLRPSLVLIIQPVPKLQYLERSTMPDDPIRWVTKQREGYARPTIYELFRFAIVSRRQIHFDACLLAEKRMSGARSSLGSPFDLHSWDYESFFDQFDTTTRFKHCQQLVLVLHSYCLLSICQHWLLFTYAGEAM